MNLLSRDQAFILAPDLVTFTELEGGSNNPQWSALYDKIDSGMQKFKKGQRVLVAATPDNPTHKTAGGKQYRVCKVTNVDHDSYQAEDGPVIRVGDDTGTWRIDGAEYAVKI
jgi:hypothetical protein